MALELQNVAKLGGRQHSDDAVCRELYAATLAEVKAKTMSGPYTKEQLQAKYGEAWIPSPRFPRVTQHSP